MRLKKFCDATYAQGLKGLQSEVIMHYGIHEYEKNEKTVGIGRAVICYNFCGYTFSY